MPNVSFMLCLIQALNRVGGRDPMFHTRSSALSFMLNIFTAAYEGKLFVVQQTVDKEPTAATSKDEVYIARLYSVKCRSWLLF